LYLTLYIYIYIYGVVSWNGVQNHFSPQKLTFADFFNHLKTKRRLLYLKTLSVPRSEHFSFRLQNQSVYAVSGTSRSLFSDKYKTHRYSVGRAYSCWIL